LTSLGFHDYELPFILLSGPVAGFIAPPIVGALSDSCQSSWGKRKPFVFWGGISVVISIILLAMAQDAAVLVCGGGTSDDSRTVGKIIAGAAMYILNFAMQPLSLGLRTHAVDNFEPHEQPFVSLWIGRWSTLGSVFVAATAYTASPPILGLSVLSCAILALFLLVSLFMTPDFSPHLEHEQTRDRRHSQPVHQQLSRTLKHTRKLSPIAQKICIIQLYSWFVWFLVLNYSSPYVTLKTIIVTNHLLKIPI
jgi:solute carrier family 45, member 1/2/4